MGLLEVHPDSSPTTRTQRLGYRLSDEEREESTEVKLVDSSPRITRPHTPGENEPPEVSENLKLLDASPEPSSGEIQLSGNPDSDLGLVDMSPGSIWDAPEPAGSKPWGRKSSGNFKRPPSAKNPRPPSAKNPRPPSAKNPRPPSAAPKLKRGQGEFYPATADAGASGKSERGPGTSGYAICSSCQAKNPSAALKCARCATALPPSVPAKQMGFSPGMGVKVVVRERTPQALEEGVLPDHAQKQLHARRVAYEERAAQGAAKHRDLRRRVVWGTTVTYMILGTGLSALFVSGWAFGATLVADGLLGAWAARRIMDGDGGPLTGQISYALATVLSLVIKFALGSYYFDATLLVLFFCMVFALGLSAGAGYLVGHAVDARPLREGF